MTTRATRATRLSKALDALASRYAFGEFLLATDPAQLIEMVIEDVDALRAAFPETVPVTSMLLPPNEATVPTTASTTATAAETATRVQHEVVRLSDALRKHLTHLFGGTCNVPVLTYTPVTHRTDNSFALRTQTRYCTYSNVWKALSDLPSWCDSFPRTANECAMIITKLQLTLLTSDLHHHRDS